MSKSQQLRDEIFKELDGDTATVGMVEYLGVAIDALIAEVRKEALEDAAKAVCSMCAKGLELQEEGIDEWVHYGPLLGMPRAAVGICCAKPIHELLRKESE